MKFHRESFSDEETTLLRRFFTNTDGPVFALVNLPEVVKGALFARYSRSPKSLRRLFLDEFSAAPELGVTAVADRLSNDDDSVRMTRAEDLYTKVFTQYGDDSVAQLGAMHLACEQASNVLTKVLEWGRLASYLEQSTRYMFYDERLGAATGMRYHRKSPTRRLPQISSQPSTDSSTPTVRSPRPSPPTTRPYFPRQRAIRDSSTAARSVPGCATTSAAFFRQRRSRTSASTLPDRRSKCCSFACGPIPSQRSVPMPI